MNELDEIRRAIKWMNESHHCDDEYESGKHSRYLMEKMLSVVESARVLRDALEPHVFHTTKSSYDEPWDNLNALLCPLERSQNDSQSAEADRG